MMVKWLTRPSKYNNSRYEGNFYNLESLFVLSLYANAQFTINGLIAPLLLQVFWWSYIFLIFVPIDDNAVFFS